MSTQAAVCCLLLALVSSLVSSFLISQKYTQNWMKLHGFCIVVLMQKHGRWGWGLGRVLFCHTYRNDLNSSTQSPIMLSTVADNRCACRRL